MPVNVGVRGRRGAVPNGLEDASSTHARVRAERTGRHWTLKPFPPQSHPAALVAKRPACPRLRDVTPACQVLELSEDGGDDEDDATAAGAAAGSGAAVGAAAAGAGGGRRGGEEAVVTKVVTINVRGLGVSLVDDAPKELVYVYMEGVQVCACVCSVVCTTLLLVVSTLLKASGL
jgi:hypothetical protein